MWRYSDKLQYVSANEQFSVIEGHSKSGTQLREHGYQIPSDTALATFALRGITHGG
jgi:hypothetical protein